MATRRTGINATWRGHFPQKRDSVSQSITIEDSSASEISVHSDALSISFTHPTLRKGIGNFRLRLTNDDGKYLRKFTKGAVIRWKWDYNDGSTLQMKGKIEDPAYVYQNGFKIDFVGLTVPEIAMKRISVDFSQGVSALQAFNTIVDDHASNQLNTNEVNALMTTTIFGKYEQKTIVYILRDILQQIDYDGYIKPDGTIKTFDKDTGVENLKESIAYSVNMLNISGFGIDSQKERNRVFVKGADIEDCPIYITKEDSDSQTASWVKDAVHVITDVTTINDAKLRAQGKLLDGTNLIAGGQAASYGLETIAPGDKIRISVQGCNIEGRYLVKEYTHSYTVNTGLKTTVTSSEEIKVDTDRFYDRIKREEDQRDLQNPNGMKNTLFIETFDSEANLTLNDCELSEGKLILSSGKTTGTCIISSVTADANFTNVELRGKMNDDSSICLFDISNDNGVTEKEVGFTGVGLNKKAGTDTTLTTTGKIGKLKITIRSDASNSNPAIDSIAMLIK